MLLLTFLFRRAPQDVSDVLRKGTYPFTRIEFDLEPPNIKAVVSDNAMAPIEVCPRNKAAQVHTFADS